MVKQCLEDAGCQEMGVCHEAEFCQVGILNSVEVNDFFDSMYNWQGTYVSTHDDGGW